MIKKFGIYNYNDLIYVFMKLGDEYNSHRGFAFGFNHALSNSEINVWLKRNYDTFNSRKNTFKIRINDKKLKEFAYLGQVDEELEKKLNKQFNKVMLGRK